MAERLSEEFVEERLLQVVELMEESAQSVAAAAESVLLAERARAEHEADLVTSGDIKGKNKEEREADLFLRMRTQTFNVVRAQAERDRRRRHFESLEREFAALKSIARMRGGEPR